MKTYIGIDVSKDSLDVSMPNKSFKVDNAETGFKKLLREVIKFENPHCVCEATGGYEKPMALFLHDNGIVVSIENPFRAKNFFRSLGGAKTDKMDAEGLRIYGERMRPKEWSVPSPLDRELAELWSRRSDLVKMLVQEKNRLDVSTNKSIKRGSQCLIRRFEKMISEVENEVLELIKTDEKKQKIYATIVDVNGCGKVAAASLVVGLPELGRLSRETVAALVGVAPYNCDSGQHRGKRFIRGGRKAVRDSLYMPTLSAMRSNEIIRAYAQRLLNKGKPFKVVLIACMRKLLIHLNAKTKLCA